MAAADTKDTSDCAGLRHCACEASAELEKEKILREETELKAKARLQGRMVAAFCLGALAPMVQEVVFGAWVGAGGQG